MATLTLSTILTFLTLITLSTPNPTQSTSAHTATSAPKSSSTDFIKSSCHVTQYPTLCYHSLFLFADKVNQNQHRLALTALAVSLSRARTVANFVSQSIKSKGIKHREMEAVKDCIDTMGDSVDQLTRSFSELGHLGRVNDGGEEFMWHMSNVQTWVSAALTDANTCLDGFSGRVMSGRLIGEISMRLINVAQLTSNALALVNGFADGP